MRFSVDSKSFQGGTNSQTKAEIEKERQAFLEDVFFAFKEFDKKKIASPKQKDLRRYIFEKYADAEQKISETLKKHNIIKCTPSSKTA